MEGHADLYIHHGGRCVKEPMLNYVGGSVHILEEFDVEYLDIIAIQNVGEIKKSLAFVCIIT